jgi:release factor glutamine methyltransferase
MLIDQARGSRTVRFGPIDIGFDDTVLEPRAWTLAQSRWAAELATDAAPGPLVELCCGAGQIGLVTALWSNRAAVLVDASSDACRWARTNAESVSQPVTVLERPVESVSTVLRDVPLLLADPPYVPTVEVPALGDLPTAVDGGRTGLDSVRSCVRAAAAVLAPGAPLVLQTRGLSQVMELEDELATLAPSLTLEAVRTYGRTRALALLRADE